MKKILTLVFLMAFVFASFGTVAMATQPADVPPDHSNVTNVTNENNLTNNNNFNNANTNKNSNTNVNVNLNKASADSSSNASIKDSGNSFSSSSIRDSGNSSSKSSVKNSGNSSIENSGNSSSASNQSSVNNVTVEVGGPAAMNMPGHSLVQPLQPELSKEGWQYCASVFPGFQNAVTVADLKMLTSSKWFNGLDIETRSLVASPKNAATWVAFLNYFPEGVKRVGLSNGFQKKKKEMDEVLLAETALPLIAETGSQYLTCVARPLYQTNATSAGMDAGGLMSKTLSAATMGAIQTGGGYGSVTSQVDRLYEIKIVAWSGLGSVPGAPNIAVRP